MKCQQCGKELTKYQTQKKNKFCSQQCDIDRRKKKIINDFSKINEDSCYWAGFFYGDGYINKKNTEARLCLSLRDEEHLVKCSHFIFGGDYVLRYKDKAILQISDANVCKNLNNFGVINKKTYLSEPIIPDGFEKHFIRGYFDADGWYSKNVYTRTDGKPYEKVSLGMCAFLEAPLITMNSLLPVPGTLRKMKNRQIYELRWQRRADIVQIREYIDGKTKLTRKWNK